MKTFPLQILKISETIFSGAAVSLSAPGAMGELTILSQHETMLTSLKAGDIIIRDDKQQQQTISIQRGFLEATKDKVTVLL